MRVIHADPYKGLPDFKAKEVWADLGFEGTALRQATDILTKLYRVFVQYDCTVLEINPLALTREGKAVAAASVMGVRQFGHVRHPESRIGTNGK